jgi:hypothetical protein
MCVCTGFFFVVHRLAILAALFLLSFLHSPFSVVIRCICWTIFLSFAFAFDATSPKVLIHLSAFVDARLYGVFYLRCSFTFPLLVFGVPAAIRAR